jgi:hypothetical protein
MKYSVISLLITATVSAQNCGLTCCSIPCAVGKREVPVRSEGLANSMIAIEERRPNTGAPKKSSVGAANSALVDLGTDYVNNVNDVDKKFASNKIDIAKTYITCDKLVDGICSGDNDECGCCTNTDCII